MHTPIFPNVKPFPKLMALLGMCVGMLLVASGLTILIPLFGGDIMDPTTLILTQCVSQLLMFLVPVILFVLFYESDERGFLKLDFHWSSWSQALAAMAIMLLFIPMIDVVTQWNDTWHFSEPLEGILREITERNQKLLESFFSQVGVGNLILNILILAVVPAVCEELFFRSVVQQTMHKWFKNAHVAIFVTAILFSLAHGEIYAFVPRAIIGVILGYLFYYSGSVVVNICAHFLNNALIVVLYFLYYREIIGFSPDELPSMGWIWTIVFVLVAAFLFYVTILRERKK